jgi:TPM domain
VIFMPRLTHLRARFRRLSSAPLSLSGGALVLAAVLTAAIVGGLALPDRAMAEDPFRLGDQIEDLAGALGSEEDEVQSALEGLQSNADVQLWLTYVNTFGGIGGQAWTDETAIMSDLGLNDVLFAVAVEDRAYFYSVDPDFELTDDQMSEIMTDQVEPELAAEDWAGAAIAAANGMSQALVGEVVAPVSSAVVQPGTTADSDGGGGFLWGGLIALLVVVALIVLIWALVRRSRKGQGKQVASDGADAQRTMTVAELRKRVGSQIVQTDDAVKTSTEEVGFAIAEFGETEAAPFQKALEEAQAELGEAFKEYRQFDEKADEETQRELLNAVLQHTGAANEKLDAQVEHFDKLRDLENQAPQVLAKLEQELATLEARVPEVKKELAELSAVYAAEALKAVASNPAEAASRISFSRERMAAGLKEVAAKKLGKAAVATLAAQEAAGQARAFLDGVGLLGKELGEARDRIDAAVAETQRDIAEARAAGAGTSTAGSGAQLAPLVATAETAVTAALSAASPDGGRDPLEALRHLEEADTALEGVLGQVRDEAAQRAKAAAALDRTLLAAIAQIRAANDYISTHRGAIGSQPRELLAEAQSYANQATMSGTSDPVTALKHASVAHELASRALSEAQRETEQAASNSGIPGLGMGSTLAGAILGGILTSALGRGTSGGGIFGSGTLGRGGGRISGGGGFGQAMSRGGFAPPSFGGMGTRMRRGGGGRF